MTRGDSDVTRLHREAQRALREGRAREAHALCLKILEADRKHADAWFLCAVIAGQNGQHAKALRILDNALTLAPACAEYLAERAKLLLALRRPRQALECALATLHSDPPDIPTLNTLGTVFSHCGENERALDCYCRAVAESRAAGRGLSPAFRADLSFNLATSLQFAGALEEARAAYEEAIALQPHNFRAHWALSGLPRDGGSPRRLAELEGLRPHATGAVDRLHLGHAMAREQERLGQFDGSLATLAWAKQNFAATVGYEPALDAALFDAMRELTSEAFIEHRAGSGPGTGEPIFVVGMPRSGTTLVEQILGSHSRVLAAGELQNFPQQVKRLAGTATPDILDLQTIEAAAHIDMAELGTAYLDSTRPRTGQKPHFVDKLPMNFLYLGLIRCALPRAKLIWVRRDPLDTCLSNYRQLFAPRFRYYHYNLDLLHCGRYYLEFDRLLAHWRERLPGAIFELHYEALVHDPKQVIGRLLDWCELPWEAACLQPGARGGSVSTPSAPQVRGGIYTGSVGHWRRYGEALDPLRELLAAAGLYDD